MKVCILSELSFNIQCSVWAFQCKIKKFEEKGQINENPVYLLKKGKIALNCHKKYLKRFG